MKPAERQMLSLERWRREKKDSPRTRQSPVTLAASPPWGSWPGWRHARSRRLVYRFVIEQGQREGSVRNDMDPVIIQELLLGTLEHYVTRWLLKDESWDLLEFREQTIKLIMNGIQSVSGEDTKMATAAKKSAAEGRRPKGEPLKNKQMT